MQKILVVEYDSAVVESFQRLVVNAFTKTKFIFESEFQIGIETAFREIPDVILLGGKDSDESLQFCRKLRSDGRTSHIPLVLLIEKERNDQLQKEAFLAGVAGFLEKNIQKWECISLLQTLLKYNQLNHQFGGNKKNSPTDDFQKQEDVVWKEKLQEELLKEKTLLKAIIDSIPVMIMHYDPDAKMIFLNREFEKLVGWKTEDIAQIDLMKTLYPDKKYRQEALEYMKEAKSDWREFKLKTKSGNFIYSEWSNVLLEDGTQIGIGLDITEFKKAVKLLKENEENLQVTLNSIGDAVIATDINGKITRMNPIAEKLCGYKWENTRGKSLQEIFHIVNAKTGKIMENPVQKVLETGKVVGLANHTMLISKNGTKYQIADSGSPIRDLTGNIIGVVLVFRDISEEYRIQEALKEREKKLREAQAIGKVGSWMFDFNTGKITISDESYHIYGLPSGKEYTIAEVQELPLPEFRKKLSRELDNLIKKNKEYNIDFKIKRPLDGQIVDIHSKAIFNKKENTVTGVIQDITEKKRADEALRLSEEKFRSVFQSAPDAIISTDDTGMVIDWNTGAEQIFGYTEDEMVGNEITIILPHNIRYQHKDRMYRIIPVNKSEIGFQTSELEGVHKTGKKFPIELSLAKWKTARGVFFTAIIRDISQRKQVEEELRKSEEKFRNYIQSSPVSVFLADKEGNFTMVNPAACLLLGYSETELLQMDISKVSSEYQISAGYENFELLKRTGNTQNFETQLKRKDGGLVDVVLDGKKVYDNEFIAFVKDITERKQTEKQLRLLSRSVEQSPVSIMITNHHGRIEYVNSTFLRVSGYSEDEVIGKKPNLLKSGNQSNELYAHLWRTISLGNEWRGELLNKTKSGDLFWEDVSISPIFDIDNQITHYVAVKEDITEKKKMVEELLAAKERAEESDRLKSAFLANMSHEIRTPMNGILGFADLLKESHITEGQKNEYVAIIEESGNRMLNTINDLIDISKIESGMVEVEYSKVFIDSQMEYLYNFFKPEANKKGLQLYYQRDERNLTTAVVTDKLKLIAILTNLVKNAIKYTFEGSIEFGFSLDFDKMNFYIKDTGVGIEKDRQQAIFDRFVQADLSISRPFEGAGLGLSISKAYIDMLGGKIWVESEKSKGSAFYFVIPIRSEDVEKTEPEKDIQEDHKTAEVLNNLTILVADDDDVAQMYLGTLFENKCKKMYFASNGKEAVELFQNNPDINLVLMDVKMPEMDGYTATLKIKEINENIIIIAQTAYALSGDREKAISSGCDDYIPKPLNKKILIEMIDKYFC